MPEIQNILCPLDFSEVSPKLAEYAKLLAQTLPAKLTLLYVAPSFSHYRDFKVQAARIDGFASSIRTGAEEAMDSFIRDYFEGVAVESRVAAGYPVEEILRAAEEIGADLIILGAHGRKGVDKLLFGSVAEKIIKSSKFPILTVRPEA